MTYPWYDFIGSLGVVMILMAYAGLQSGRMTARQLRYNILNLAGASAILLSLIFDFNLSAFLMELAWIFISLYGLAQALRARAE